MIGFAVRIDYKRRRYGHREMDSDLRVCVPEGRRFIYCSMTFGNRHCTLDALDTLSQKRIRALHCADWGEGAPVGREAWRAVPPQVAS